MANYFRDRPQPQPEPTPTTATDSSTEPTQTLPVVPVEQDSTKVTVDFNKFEKKVETYILAIWRTLTTAFFIVALIMLIIGAMYVNSCSGSRFIPIYLMVAGILGIVHFLVMLGECCRKKPKYSLFAEGNYRFLEFTNGLFALFLGWTFFGSIPILMTDIQTTNPDAEMYCNIVPFTAGFYGSAVLDVLYISLFMVGFVTLCACGIISPETYRQHL